LNATAWGLLGAAAALAVADWIAVSPGVQAKRAEYALKPAVMVALIAAALCLDPGHDAQRVWFVAALALSLAGDVFLMLPSDAFVAGLASFLLAHVAYVIGFAIVELSAGWILAGVGVVLVAGAPLGRKIVGAVAGGQHRELVVPVSAYMTVISSMVVLALGSAEPVAATGALFFYSSDALIAWDRFVQPKPWARPAIMATYHVAQAALVLSLAR
jgi:uncharacterized membrane protein YhhN